VFYWLLLDGRDKELGMLFALRDYEVQTCTNGLLAGELLGALGGLRVGGHESFGSNHRGFTEELCEGSV